MTSIMQTNQTMNKEPIPKNQAFYKEWIRVHGKVFELEAGPSHG